MTPLCALSYDDMLDHNAKAAARWREWLTRHPQAGEIPCDIMNAGSVAGLVKHICLVELRYAQRLNGMDMTSYEDGSRETFEQLFAYHDQAQELYRRFLAAATDESVRREFEVKTRSAGSFITAPRTIFIHAMQHSIRHWAQLAVLLRKAGMPTDWGQDYLFLYSKPR